MQSGIFLSVCEGRVGSSVYGSVHFVNVEVKSLLASGHVEHEVISIIPLCFVISLYLSLQQGPNSEHMRPQVYLFKKTYKLCGSTWAVSCPY